MFDLKESQSIVNKANRNIRIIQKKMKIIDIKLGLQEQSEGAK
jgi:hypothetical protein